MKKLLLLLVWTLFFTVSSLGATIQGTVYDIALDELNNAIVEVNTEPKQVMVAKDGIYSFNVPEGDYIIKAIYRDELEAAESITVIAEGEFTLDLILLPIFEEEFLAETEFEIGTEYEELLENGAERNKLDKTVLIALIIVSFLIMIWVAMRIKKRGKKEKREMIKEDKEKVLDFLKKQGGRALQKDIRKHLALSEAKASLLVDELAAKGKVEKIKKGRGNIVILK